jgi:transposase
MSAVLLLVAKVTSTARNDDGSYKTSMISAVSSSGAMFFECFEDKMNSERFIVFLKALRAEAKRPIAVIVDGGSYHKSKMVREFLKTEGDTLLIKLVMKSEPGRL